METMTEHKLPVSVQPRRYCFIAIAACSVVFTYLLSPSAIAAQPCPPPQLEAEEGTKVASDDNCPESPRDASQTADYRDPVAGVTLQAGRTTVNASTSAELASVLKSADCGQDIRLAPGSYQGTFTLNTSCPANNPVIVKGAANFASSLDGTITVQGARNILSGIFFRGSNAGAVLSGTNNKLIGNKLTGWGGPAQCRKVAVVVNMHSSEAEIAYNEIYSPAPWATAGCKGPQLRMGIRTNDDNETDFPYGAWVHHNYFHDFPPKPNPSDYNSGQDDALEIGQTQGGRMPLVNAGWYVEDNRVENHLQKHGTVDLKVGGVVYRRNTFIDTPGRVDSRGSTLYGSIIESNYHRRSGGSTVHGKGHKIVCNDFDGTIALKAGDIACDAINPTDADTHAHVCDVLVSGNRASLIVGKVDGSDENLPARNTTIRAHSGGVTRQLDSGLRDERTLAPTYECAIARETTASQVGPAALSRASAAYRGPRDL